MLFIAEGYKLLADRAELRLKRINTRGSREHTVHAEEFSLWRILLWRLSMNTPTPLEDEPARCVNAPRTHCSSPQA